MLQALFNSLSGLFAFSKNLDTISNNIANMNTPGFRGSDSNFENVIHTIDEITIGVENELAGARGRVPNPIGRCWSAAPMRTSPCWNKRSTT